MTRQRFLNLLLPAALTALSAACTDDAPSVPGAVRFQAQGTLTVDVTRATYEGSWRTTDEIAVRRSDGTVRKFVPDDALAATSLSPATGVQPFLWPVDMSNQTFSAWAPYSATQPTSKTVDADQSAVTDAVFYGYDLLYAPAVTTTYGNTVGLTFKHQLALVLVDVVSTPETVSSVTFGSANVKTSGTVSMAATPSWSSLSGANTITMRRIGSSAAGGNYACLLPPQSFGNASTALISVTTSAKTYTYKAAVTLVAGQKNAYNVTVEKTGITVTGTITNWTNGGTTNGGTLEVVGE